MNAPPAILTEAALASASEREREVGRTVAFANGCFDLFHVGHLRDPQRAKAEADLPPGAVHSDASTRAYQGPGRPVVPEV